MKSGYRPLVGFLLILSVDFLSCGGMKGDIADENGIDEPEIPVEAYLFDVKLRRNGKPTSFRLDIYQTDSAVAMYGRGYFNKGAFRGILTDDSLLINFPSSKEYLRESIESLFQSFDCEKDLIAVNLLGYFASLPDSGHISEDLSVETVEQDGQSRKVKVTSINCPWELLIGYGLKEKGWRIDSFEFDDRESVTLKGELRNYKVDSSVSQSRFKLSIPDNFIKLTL